MVEPRAVCPSKERFLEVNNPPQSSTNKVYVVQESPGKNLVAAQSFGELETLLTQDRQIAFNSQPVVRALRTKLRQFSDHDYILCIGDPAAIGIAIAIACLFNEGRCKLLKWDRQSTSYYPVSFDLSGKEIEANA